MKNAKVGADVLEYGHAGKETCIIQKQYLLTRPNITHVSLARTTISYMNALTGQVT